MASSFTSSSFLEKLRKGYCYASTSSKTASNALGFFDALVEQKECPPQRCFQRIAEAVCKLKYARVSATPVAESIKLTRISENERLSLALAYYHDKAQREKLEAELKTAVARIESETQGKRAEESLSGLLEADLEVFSQWCIEVSEVYIYFTFLDIKGDRSLLMLVAKRLQFLLASTSITNLVASLKKTRPWAEMAWQMMAQQRESALLQRQHTKTLLQWLVVAKDTVNASISETGLKAFWETCFSGLQRIPWHDFVDSVQEQFLKGFCPKDLLEPLRRRVAKKSHHVTRQHWEVLLETYDHSMTDLLDALLEEVLQDIPTRIYRAIFKECDHGEAAGCHEGCHEGQRRASESTKRTRPARELGGAHGPRLSMGLNSPLERSSAADSCFVQDPGNELERMDGSHTPEDPRLHMRPVETGQKIEWTTYVEELCKAEMRWWTDDGGPSPQEDKLRLSAIRAVNSELSVTRKALVLRVASGELAKHRPILDFGGESPLLPAVLVSPNDITMSPAVTKFGRGSKRKMMLPDMFMNEQIASRSHFSISFDTTSQRYQIMDAGSKWGTFLKVGPKGADLSCGDWIRIGNAELVIRFCGGSCSKKCSLRHNQSRQRSLYMSALNSFPGLRPSSLCSDKESDDEISSHCASLLSGRARPLSSNAVDKMCQHSALQSEKTRIHPWSSKAPTAAPLPWAPVELDFVSGPRMGERLLVTERYCTIGRADSCTIQISDPMLANVSRTHCILHNTGHGAKIMDNNSTNGTWKRLSCVLEPSEPQELTHGSCILAGVHEFRIEEAEMSRDWIPSVAGRTLQLAMR